MLTPPVVEPLDRGDEVSTGFLARQIRALRRAHALQAAQKALRDCLVYTIPFAAHAACHTMGSQARSVGMTGVLRTTSTLVSPAGVRLAAAKRQLPRGSHPWGLTRIAHRPPHPLAGIPVQKSRGLPPACLGPHRGASAAPRHMGRRHSNVAGPQMRRHPLPMTTLGGLWATTAAALDGHPGLWHATTPLAAPHLLPLVLALLGHATTAITGGRLV